jgi:hypothetical protein
MSLSSIPYPSHARVTIGPAAIDLTQAFPAGEWEGSKDRRWVEVPLPGGLPALLDDKSRPFNLTVSLTHEGSDAEAGQGGKMVTSIEIIEYGGDGRCNTTQGFVGAFPTYALDGGVTLRPVSLNHMAELTDR